MIKTILFSFLFTVAAFAQRTPLKINGTIVNNPNFTNTASLSWAVTGSDIRGTAAGGGDTLWTNDNGTISANSTVADGGTAFLMNSSNTLATGKLLLLENDGTSEAAFGESGQLIIGPNTETQWGAVLPGETLLRVQDPSAGDSELFGLHNFVVEPGSQGWAGWEAYGGTNFNAMYLYAVSSNSTTTWWRMANAADPSGGTDENDSAHLYFKNRDNRKLIYFRPDIASGTTPYTFDTGVSHATGNLIEGKNNGTNGFVVAAVSGYTGAGTKFLSDDGTYKTAGGSGIAGTVINTGTPAVGNVPYYTDTTGTNIAPLTTGFYSGAILTPWVGTNNALTLQWKKSPQVWEFAGGAVGEWVSINTGGGTASQGSQTPDLAENTVWSGGTASGTNSTGGFRGSALTTVFTTNKVAVLWRIRTPAALSSDVDGYELYAGFGDATGDAAPTDGAYFYYSHLTSNGVWTAKTANNSSVTFASGAASEITVAVDTWYSLLVEGNSTVVNFWVSQNDGATWQWIGFSTANIPTTVARSTGIEAYIRKIGGSTGTTTRTAYYGRCELWPNRNN